MLRQPQRPQSPEPSHAHFLEATPPTPSQAGPEPLPLSESHAPNTEPRPPAQTTPPTVKPRPLSRSTPTFSKPRPQKLHHAHWPKPRPLMRSHAPSLFHAPPSEAPPPGSDHAYFHEATPPSRTTPTSSKPRPQTRATTGPCPVLASVAVGGCLGWGVGCELCSCPQRGGDRGLRPLPVTPGGPGACAASPGQTEAACWDPCVVRAFCR